MSPLNRLHVVGGDIRLGEINTSGSTPGYGRYLHFSGGPLGANGDSENSDPLWIARYNLSSDVTELRIFIGDNCNPLTADALVIRAGGAFNECSEGEKFRFSSTGDAYKPGGGSWAVLSDTRLKTAVMPFSLGLKELLQVNPITYQYNGLTDFASYTGKTYVGVIAQELQKVAPFMVSQFANTEYLSVDPSAFTYMLINAVKEQQSYINNQYSYIKKLEERIEKLEERIEKLETLLNKN